MRFLRSCQGYIHQYQSLIRKSSSTAISTSAAVPQYPIMEGHHRSPENLAGSRCSRRLRRAGMIPGVIYGWTETEKQVSIKVMVPVKPLNKLIRETKHSFECTVQTLRLDDDSKYLVTARQLQVDPLSDSPQSLNFLLYHPGNLLRIPFVYEDADLSTDLKRGCFIKKVHQFIECVCTGSVPTSITVNLANAKKGDVIRVDTIEFPPGVKPSKNVKKDFIVAVVQSAKNLK